MAHCAARTASSTGTVTASRWRRSTFPTHPTSRRFRRRSCVRGTSTARAPSTGSGFSHERSEASRVAGAPDRIERGRRSSPGADLRLREPGPAVRPPRGRSRVAHDARGEGVADAGRGTGDRAAGDPGVQLVERGAARGRPLRTRHLVPQAIGLAATWDDSLMFRMASVISDEARAKHHEYVRTGSRRRYQGLTFWSPNINLFRDPRWGRGQETYGEDPFLTGRMAVAFVTGMQGNDAHYFKVISTPKHYAVHSGPEVWRHQFDPDPSAHDLADTYAPAFRAAIVEGKADSVMCAYSAVNGVPACASDKLYELLRKDWGFRGYVVSDCGAIGDIYAGHGYVMTLPQAAAVTVKAGTDLNCGSGYYILRYSVADRLISREEIDRAVKRLFEARSRL